MASRSSAAEQIAVLQKEAAVLDQQLKAQAAVLGEFTRTLDKHDLPTLRERLARCEEKTDKLVKDRDESSRRGTQLALVGVGAVFTLLVQVSVQLLIRSLGK